MSKTWVIYCEETEKLQYHNEDGPAVEWSNGDKEWFIDDKLHRTDGPAIDYTDGFKQWFLHGVEYNCLEWLLKVHELEQRIEQIS